MLLLIIILILFKRHMQDARSRIPPLPHTPKTNSWTRVIDPDTRKKNWIHPSLSSFRVCAFSPPVLLPFIPGTHIPRVTWRETKNTKTSHWFLLLVFQNKNETNSNCINKLKDKFLRVCIGDFFSLCQTRHTFPSLLSLEFLWTKLRSMRD